MGISFVATTQMERFKWFGLELLLLLLHTQAKIKSSQIITTTTITVHIFSKPTKTTTTTIGFAATTAPQLNGTFCSALSSSTSSSILTSAPSPATAPASAYSYRVCPACCCFSLSSLLRKVSCRCCCKSSVTTMGSCFGRCVSKEPLPSLPPACLWRRNTDEQEAELISNASDTCKKKSLIFRIIKFKRKQKRPQFIDKFWEHKDMNYAKLPTKNGNDSISDIQLQNLDVNNLLTSKHCAKESTMNYALGSHTAITSSRASSSLDLEWEHEYVRQYAQQPALSQAHAEHTNARDNQNSLTDSWQLLSANDEDQLNSIGSLENSLPAAATTTPEIALANGERRLARALVNRQNGVRNGSFTRTSSHNSWSHISTPESLEWDIDEEQQRQMRVEDDNLDHETLELLHQIEQLKNQVLNETGEGLYESGAGGGIEFSANANKTSSSTATTTNKCIEFRGRSGEAIDIS